MCNARKIFAKCVLYMSAKGRASLKHVPLRHALDHSLGADDLTVRACNCIHARTTLVGTKNQEHQSQYQGRGAKLYFVGFLQNSRDHLQQETTYSHERKNTRLKMLHDHLETPSPYLTLQESSENGSLQRYSSMNSQLGK